MSHFTVLVIGDDVDAALAPFHEFECTGEDDQYVQDVDVTEEVQKQIAESESLEDGLDYYGLNAINCESKIDKSGEHKYGYAIVKDGQLIKAIDRTNPNKKWDWWVVGGRWSGSLTLKDSARKVDSAKKSEIDFAGMRDTAGEEAAASWDSLNEATGGAQWEPWKAVRNRIANIDEAREFYGSQEPVKAIRKLHYHPFFNADQYLCSRDDFVKQARDRAGTTYAIAMDGKWYSKGEMGWWGISTDDVSQDEWNAKFAELIDSLPDETLLTVVDCHI